MGQDFITIIQTVGFPICMCVWLLTRSDKRIERLTAMVQKQVTALAVIARTLDALPEADREKVAKLLEAEDET